MNIYVKEVEQGLNRLYQNMYKGGCGHGVDMARYVASDMTVQEKAEFENSLNQCPSCQEDIATFESLEEIWSEKKLPSRSLSFRWSPAWILSACATTALILVVMFFASTSTDKKGRLQPKGIWQMHVAAQRNGANFRVENGSMLEVGDQLGFFYSARKPGYLTIMYTDQSGQIVRIFPATADNSAFIEPGDRVRLPDGAKVSTGQGCEWVIGLFSKNNLSDKMSQEIITGMLAERDKCRLKAPDQKLIEQLSIDVQIIQVNR
jgi:hypothetical protein